MGKYYYYVIGLTLLFTGVDSCLAEEAAAPVADSQQADADYSSGPVETRAKKEDLIPPNFAITFYKPTYILPYYYTGSPFESIYQGNTPDNEQIQRYEVKFQLSFKVPVLKNLIRKGS